MFYYSYSYCIFLCLYFLLSCTVFLLISINLLLKKKKKKSESSIKKIQTAQNAALMTATGARWKSGTTHICYMRNTSWTVWRRTTSVMASQLKSQDLDPWGTLHYRHHSTVLPSAQAGRKTTRTCTHAVDSVIQLLGNNKVLKERPPPIADEEQRLNRGKWCTLSQLRSGHCHLLQDYKHRVFGEPSDNCTDTFLLATHTR